MSSTLLKSFFSYKKGIRIGILLIILWHLWSLQYSPLPWFDETFFASITNSFINSKGFQLEICPLQTGGVPVLTYGPVYFLLTAIPIKLAGLGIFQFRIISLVFIFMVIILFSKIIRNFGLNKTYQKWLIILIVFDVIIVQNSHSGRMDMVALFFAIFAWWAYLNKRPNQTIFQITIMGLAGVSAILTTPRIAVIVFPIFIFAFYHFIKSKQWVYSLIITIIPLIIYLIWVWLAFDSLTNFWEHYFSKSANIDASNSNLSDFLGGNFYIPFYQWPIIITGIFSLLVAFITRKNINDILLFLSPIILFYTLVKDTGAYSALIISFWYIIIGLGGLSPYFKKTRVILLTGLGVITVVNLGIFTIKAIAIIGSIDQRDPKAISHWIKDNVPEKSKIVGDDRYYYACLQNNCDFQYIERIKSHQERAKYHATYYKPDYLFISNQTSPEIVEAYREQFYFIEKDQYQNNKKTNNLFHRLIDKLPIKIFTSYEGTLIKVSSKSSRSE